MLVIRILLLYCYQNNLLGLLDKEHFMVMFLELNIL